MVNQNGSVTLMHNIDITDLLNINTTTSQDLIDIGEHFDDTPSLYQRGVQNDEQRNNLHIHMENALEQGH